MSTVSEIYSKFSFYFLQGFRIHKTFAFFFFNFRKKFRSAQEVYMHCCAIHVPDSIDLNAEIYCQWGLGPNLCDNLPRKRFSLMTHINDRHCTLDALKASVQRRLAAGPQPNQPTQPVTIIKNPQMTAAAGTASPAPSTSSTGSLNTGSSSAAMQAIKRHTLDLVNTKEKVTKVSRTSMRKLFYNQIKFNLILICRMRTKAR